MSDSRTEVRDGLRFAFGANWRAFSDLVDEARIQSAVDSLTRPLGTADLSDRTFLDIGCGSGLSSLAAHRLGARVRSFDFDPECVAVSIELRARFAPESDWTIEQGSILDESYVAGLGHFDIVYSWGVLHHTGELWGALTAASRLVAPSGLLYISVYNDQGFKSRLWRRIKRQYNDSGPMMRRALLFGATVNQARHWPRRKIARLVRGADGTPPPRGRGMSAKHDLVDWVGGYPFEVAKPEEVFSFLHPLDYELRYLKTCGGDLGCNEYVLERGNTAERPIAVAVPLGAEG